MDSTQITARAPQELVKRLDRFAEETHRTRAGAILLFLEQGLARHEHGEPESAQAGGRKGDER
jgi:predicted transcriptional regulator